MNSRSQYPFPHSIAHRDAHKTYDFILKSCFMALYELKIPIGLPLPPSRHGFAIRDIIKNRI